MLTKILPAGDLFEYLKAPKDSMGVEREHPPDRIRGDDGIMTELLSAQASFGVRPKNCQNRFRLPIRPHSEWVRHCQRHLVHLINCFHEEDNLVTPHLKPIAKATEDLILAGLPRDALHFTWYRHGKTKGTHAHGGMGRILLRDGQPYMPRLSFALRQLFDRLVSRRLGFADPLDPNGFRIAYGGRGSWKPENYEIIRSVCQEATRRWRKRPPVKRDYFADLLTEFGLTVLSVPDEHGRPKLLPKGAGLRAPCYPNTVVACRRDSNKFIIFTGPACRGDFTPEQWQEKYELRKKAVSDLQQFPQHFFAQFERQLGDRAADQRRRFPGARGDECVSITQFQWLNPSSQRGMELTVPSQLSEDDAYRPDMYWGDRLYPFVSDTDPELADITDVSKSPLRDWIEDNENALNLESEEAGKMSDPAEGRPAPQTSTLDPEIITQSTPPSSERLPAPAIAAPTICAEQPTGAPEEPGLKFYGAANLAARRRLQLALSLETARAHEDLRRKKRKKKEVERQQEFGGDKEKPPGGLKLERSGPQPEPEKPFNGSATPPTKPPSAWDSDMD